MIGSFGPLEAGSQQRRNIPAAGVFASDDEIKRLSDLHILIVEDEIFVAIAIEDALVSAGAQILGPAMSVASGLALLNDSPAISGAILDVNLVDELVFPLAEYLRDQGVPIIFHTAHYDQSMINEAFPDAIICSKPALNEELVRLAAAHFG